MRNARGFTLAELLVVVAVLGVIMAGIVAIQQQGQQAYVMGASRVDAQQNARVALTLMSRELRAACTLSSLSSTAVTFTIVDSSQPSTADCSGTTVAVRYAFSGSSLYRDQAATVGALPAVGSGTLLISGVANLHLDGWDNAGHDTDNSPAPTPGAGCGSGTICSVDLKLWTTTEQSVASYSLANVRSVLESRVRLRNI